MLQNVSTLTVLLVCVLSKSAHAASFQWGWEISPSRSIRSIPNQFSVVEDWISVCEDVCGAGYGGPGCGGHCLVYTTTGRNLRPLIDGLSDMCQALCENNLGSRKCNCALSYVNSADKTNERNLLCSASCTWRPPLRLNGCSVCTNESLPAISSEENDSSENATIPNDDTTVDDGTTNTDEGSTIDEGSATDLTDQENSTEESSTTDETTTESPTTTTTSTTTTTTQPTTTTTKSTTQATTTPNWESMCEALCRNGEGGSFCNCDIPPFF